ncbi:MAG: dephospho-CoA kinase [Clostridia bacterium]|nr:dephospho-CoA kinase [Clostridia bacterium]
MAEGARARLRLLGLTGGIASGKSTVAKMLAGLGAVVIDADRVAREVVEPGEPALAEIARRWPDVVGADGRLDRRRLGERVFARPEELAELERITHPRIRRRIEERLAGLAASAGKEASPRVVVVEAALLLRDGGGWLPFEEIWSVRCDEAEQIRRLRARDGLSEEEARRRLAAQTPPERLSAGAQVVIDNSDGLERTRAQVEAAWRRFLAGGGGTEAVR